MNLGLLAKRIKNPIGGKTGAAMNLTGTRRRQSVRATSTQVGVVSSRKKNRQVT